MCLPCCLDGGDANFDLRQPAAQCLCVLPIREQGNIGDADEKRVRHWPQLGDVGHCAACSDLAASWCGVEHAARRCGRGSLRNVDKAALFHFREQIVDRGEPDVGPLPDAALLDHLLQVVAMLRAFEDQAQHGQLGRGELGGVQLHCDILVLEYLAGQQGQGNSSSSREPPSGDLRLRVMSDTDSTALVDDRATDDLPPALRRDVGILGETLDQVLAEAGGSDLLNDVQRLRRATLSLRSSQDGAVREQVMGIVEGFEFSRAEAVARAFTIYFQLVNLAEERHRVRTLQDRRRGRDAIADSIAAAVDEVIAKHGRPLLDSLLGQLCIQPVVTAHPTEARRRAVSDALGRVSAQLELLDDPHMSRVGAATLRRRLLEEVAILWRTSQLRAARPTPLDEVRRALAVFDETIFRTLPLVYREMDRALGPETVGTRPPAMPGFLRWGSWIGGDRDGNPHVTAEVTTKTLEIHAQHTLLGLENAAARIGRTLSASESSTPASRDLQRMLSLDKEELPELAASLIGQTEEPHRRKMSFITRRLAATRGGQDDRYLSPEDLIADLRTVQKSLSDAGAKRLAFGELQHLIWQVETFGFHFASLEIRQASTVHEAVVEELLPGASTDLDTLDRLAVEGWPSDCVANSDEAQELIATFRAVADIQLRYGVAACRRWCISWTRSARDVAAVAALARFAVPDGSLVLDVVPLFESRKDLEGAVDVMTQVFALPGQKERLEQRGRHVEVMLGYSDSAKDAGFLAANVALYRAQAALAAWAKDNAIHLTLFHGRGGGMGRGGGPTNRAILGQAPGSVGSRFKVTEQGEIVFARYANVPLAERHLEQVTNAVVQASARDHAEEYVPDVDWDTVDLMVTASEEKYRALVETEGFSDFFYEVTPSAEIAALQIGSRPAKRSADGGLSSLRAIPWVFAWTQNRCNLPGWYGLGTGLQAIANKDGGLRILTDLQQSWPFMTTLLDNAELSLVKADALIAELYFAMSTRTDLVDDLRAEMDLTEELVLKVTGRTRLLEHRPVLRRAVDLRNPYVDALSFLQVRFLSELREGVGDRQAERMREVVMLTVNGVAAGLQNTG